MIDSFNDLKPGHSIKAHIIFDDDTISRIRNKKIIVFYLGKIGSEDGMATCVASTPKGGFAHSD